MRGPQGSLIGALFLTLAWAGYFRDLVHPTSVGAWVLLYHGLFHLYDRLRLRSGLGLFLALGTPLLLRGLVSVGLPLLSGPEAEPLDRLLPLFDRSLVLGLVPAFLHWAGLLATRRYPGFTRWRHAVHLALFSLLASGESFGLGDQPAQPLERLVAAALFCLWELEGLRRDQSPIQTPPHPSLLLVLLPLASAMIWAFSAYRESSRSAQAGLLHPTLFGVDLSDLVRLESEIRLTDNLLFVVHIPTPPGRFLLRRHVLNVYLPNQGFGLDPAYLGPGERAMRADGPLLLPPPLGDSRVPRVHEIFLVNFEAGSVVALSEPVRLQRLTGFDTTRFQEAWRVESAVLVDRPPLARTPAEAKVNQDIWDFYTRVPHDPALRDLALRLKGSLDDPSLIADRIEHHLKSEYLYSLRPGPPTGGNPIHTFLFQTRRGYCSYFAISMALLMRHLGYPARVAVGFFTDPSRHVLGFYPIRAYHAHAWVELLSAGEGWMAFDPTSETLAPGETFSFPDESPGEFLSMVESLLSGDLRSEEAPARAPVAESAPLPLGSLLGMAIALIFLAWKLRWRALLALAKDPRRKIRLLYRRTRAWLERRRQEGRLSPLEFARAVDRPEFYRLTEAYLRALYGPEPPDPNTVALCHGLSRRLLVPTHPWQWARLLWF